MAKTVDNKPVLYYFSDNTDHVQLAKNILEHSISIIICPESMRPNFDTSNLPSYPKDFFTHNNPKSSNKI